MPAWIRCPSCRYSLEGAPGVPSEAHGRFVAEVRCPECGFVLPAGCRVFVGASSPHALVRGRPLLARAWIRFSWGDGAFAAVMFALAGLIPAFGAAAARDILATGSVASRIQLAGVVGLWCFSLAWVARSCWRRFGAVGADGRRAEETERALVVSGQGVREGGRSLAASTIRRIRVYECMPADDGQVVVALHAGARPRFGFRQETRPVYAVVPNGTAQRLADELMAVVRGRLEPASEIGDEVSGEAPARDSVPRVMRSLVVACLPIAALIGLLVDLRVFVDILLMLFIAVLFAKLNRPGVMTIRFRAHAIELSGRFDTWYERQVAVAYPRLQRLDLTQRRGMPQMTLRLRASAESSEIDCDDIKIVPDDLLGMTPEEFAQKFADRLRVPLRCTGSTDGWASS